MQLLFDLNTYTGLTFSALHCVLFGLSSYGGSWQRFGFRMHFGDWIFVHAVGFFNAPGSYAGQLLSVQSNLAWDYPSSKNQKRFGNALFPDPSLETSK